MPAKTILFLLPMQREHIDNVIDELRDIGFTSVVHHYDEATTTASFLETDTTGHTISLIVYPENLLDGESFGIQNDVSAFLRLMSRRGVPALSLVTDLGGPFDDALVFRGAPKEVARQIAENARTPEENTLRDEWLRLVRDDGEMLIHAPEAIRADREIVLAALRDVPHVFRYASPELLGDKELAKECVRRNGWMLEHVSATLRADREIVFLAVTAKREAIKFASSELQNDTEILEALGGNPKTHNST